MPDSNLPKHESATALARELSPHRPGKRTFFKIPIILLSSVGSSERLLTARSLVRVQQGEPQKKERTSVLSFFVAPPVVLDPKEPPSGLLLFWRKGWG